LAHRFIALLPALEKETAAMDSAQLAKINDENGRGPALQQYVDLNKDFDTELVALDKACPA